jgi:hypothetical protein
MAAVCFNKYLTAHRVKIVHADEILQFKFDVYSKAEDEAHAK